jgi:hypothetical protein
MRSGTASALLLACACVYGCGDDGAADGEQPTGDAAAQSPDAAADARAPSGNAGNTGARPDGGTSMAGGAGTGSGGSKPPAAAGTSGGGDGACEGIAPNTLPEELACTGLYADFARKEVADGVHAFAPAHQLWSDGADKQRWISLPEGTQIDSSVPNDWKFPVGTKLFKEFSWDGHRVETRLFWKIGDNRWIKAAYHWNEDESAATRFAGGEVDVAGHSYYIPSPKECDQCHKGRADRALGFELVSLGLAGAEGMTVQKLIDEGLLTDEPSSAELEIGDDGSGNAAPALGWLHANCGVSCHNDNPSAEGYSSDLRLRLAAEELDGSSTAEAAAITTTVGVGAKTPRWLDRPRITPGSPEDSLLYVLATTRNAASPKDQMPPIASRVVDPDGAMLLEAWIRSMPAD